MVSFLSYSNKLYLSSHQAKMKKLYLLLLLILLIGTSAIFIDGNSIDSVAKRRLNIDEMSAENVLLMLGDDTIQHSLQYADPEQVKIGEDLVLYGMTVKDGKETNRISKHFVCIDCHNIGREFSDLSGESPEDRLNYAAENNIPFLPGSTFFGMYNRTSFYNKDYVKKYGDLVLNARDTLSNATQVCAEYCSSGRVLEDWELTAIMHYYKSLELKVKDLDLTGNQKKNIEKYGQLSKEERMQLIVDIKASYISGYDATFLETMPRDQRKYGDGGDPKKGELIYEKSCLHCHGDGRLTYLILGKTKLDARMFWRNRKNYSDKSLYQIVRHGTYAKTGRKQYMPLYTNEKMSDEQLNDLMAYIKQLSGK